MSKGIHLLKLDHATLEQVAHDIRSPLFALEVILSSADQLPENLRGLLQNTVLRIREIVTDLMTERTSSKHSQADWVSLWPLLSGLVEEKRWEHRHLENVQIELERDEGSKEYGKIVLWAESSSLKRLISNLINNGVEALGGHGVIRVCPHIVNGRAEIRIQDNGKGIPSEVIQYVGQRGFTFAKAGGSGLGLFHARAAMESWGGSLGLTSWVGQGTEIVLSFAQQPGEEPVLLAA